MIKKKKDIERFKEVNFPALNVRSEPSTSALIVNVITMGTIVECDPNFDNKYWDHIFKSPNIEGYCMKEYLSPVDPDKLAEFMRLNPIVIHTDKSMCDGNAKENEDDSEEKEQ